MIQDVVAVFSNKGWKQFCQEMNRLESEDVAEISDFVNKSSACIVHNNNVLFRFDNQNTSQNNFFLFTDTLNNVDRDGFLFVSLTKDGSENFFGEYHNNPFNINISKVIAYDSSKNDAEHIALTSNPLTNNVMNNHTCKVCGNTKCSKAETSCWKCGHSIK